MRILNFRDLDTADKEVVLKASEAAILERLKYCTSTTRWLNQIRTLASSNEKGYVMCAPSGEPDFCWISKENILGMEEEDPDNGLYSSMLFTIDQAYLQHIVLVGAVLQSSESVAVYTSALGGVFLTDPPCPFRWIALPHKVLLGQRSKIVTRINLGGYRMQVNLGFARQPKAMVGFKKKR